MGGKRGGHNSGATATGGATAYASGYPQESSSSPPFPQGDRNPYADENDGWKEGDPVPLEIAAMLPENFTAEDVHREMEKHRERVRKAELGAQNTKKKVATDKWYASQALIEERKKKEERAREKEVDDLYVQRARREYCYENVPISPDEDTAYYGLKKASWDRNPRYWNADTYSGSDTDYETELDHPLRCLLCWKVMYKTKDSILAHLDSKDHVRKLANQGGPKKSTTVGFSGVPAGSASSSSSSSSSSSGAGGTGAAVQRRASEASGGEEFSQVEEHNLAGDPTYGHLMDAQGEFLPCTRTEKLPNGEERTLEYSVKGMYEKECVQGVWQVKCLLCSRLAYENHVTSQAHKTKEDNFVWTQKSMRRSQVIPCIKAPWLMNVQQAGDIYTYCLLCDKQTSVDDEDLCHKGEETAGMSKEHKKKLQNCGRVHPGLCKKVREGRAAKIAADPEFYAESIAQLAQGGKQFKKMLLQTGKIEERVYDQQEEDLLGKWELPKELQYPGWKSTFDGTDWS